MSFVSILFAVVATNIFRGGLQHTPPEVRHAMRYGAETKVVFHVSDDEGKPVKDASVGAAFYMHGKKGYGRKGLTDATGCFTAQQMSVGEVNYWINKDGYYETHGRIWFAGDIYKCGEVKDGKWQPYGKTYEVVLKKIRTPVSMSAYSCTREIPLLKTEMGFDLRVGDFVKPFGKGLVADFVLKYDECQENYWKYRAEMSLFFTNALDGAYVRSKDTSSRFWSDYHASTNMSYQKEFTFVNDRLVSPREAKSRMIEENQYLVLRTRTKVDEKGNLTEAFYSKIYGPIKFSRKKVSFRIYVNPVPNSTNLEFDPSMNLQKSYPEFLLQRDP